MFYFTNETVGKILRPEERMKIKGNGKATVKANQK